MLIRVFHYDEVAENEKQTPERDRHGLALSEISEHFLYWTKKPNISMFSILSIILVIIDHVINETN